MTSVLVCDDSPLAREALRRAVATVPGVERVTTAANGEEVLRRWGADRSDLILMDVRMPGLGGVETVQPAPLGRPRRPDHHADGR